MTTFKGTLDDFERYHGPVVRTKVQQIAKKAKKARNGTCEQCNKTHPELDSVPVKGRSRLDIMQKILSPYMDADKVINCQLETAEQEIIDAHLPIENTFKFLCASCHRKYDQKERVVTIRPNEKPVPYYLKTLYLPITISPENELEFKTLLLDRREATIITYYKNGTSSQRVWNASRFREDSDVFGHIRMRPEFRPGKWQELNIQKVHVIVE